MNDPSNLEPRLISIETQLMHLQYDFEQVNALCLRQESLIQKQARRIESLEKQLQALLGGGNASAGDAED